MKVTVNTFLNVRVGKPSVNAPCYQYLAPGSELEVEDRLYKGDMYEGSNLWYRDQAKNYYWAGGVAKPEEKEPEPLAPQTGFADYINARFKNGTLLGTINYNDLLALDPALKNNQGAGATIGILDHGISPNVPLKHLGRISNVQPPPMPANGHGCYMASLIAGNGTIRGIAPLCNVMEFPLYDPVGYKQPQLLQNVINYVKQQSQKQFIINVSQAISPAEMATYEPLFKNLRALDNVILVAAAGTNEELCAPQIQYPASMDGVIAVGSINKALMAGLNPQVDLLVPELLYAAYAKQTGKFEYASGDSSACAVVTGITALICAQNTVPFAFASFLAALKAKAVPLSSVTSFDSLNLIKP